MNPADAPTVRLPPSTLEIPGYAVEDLLGQGGMGRVDKARDLALQRVVAVKLLARTADEASIARFDQEVKAVAALRHPHIAQIHETGTVDGRPYYAMEYVAGGSLRIAQPADGRRNRRD